MVKGTHMATMIHDRVLEQRLRDERKACGADRFDEVWEGVYVMAPMPNNEHQFLVTRLSRVLDEIVTDGNLGQVLASVNVSDRVQAWEQNYRVPDVAVFLHDTKAENHETFWFGGPDLVIEIISRDDLSREKIAFYGAVGSRELLLVDRDPWQIELYRTAGSELRLIETSSLQDPRSLTSEVIGAEIRLQPASGRPTLYLQHSASKRQWII
jgi:Uma2 family endonuclease